MGWKFIFFVVLLVGGAVGYYLWDQTPDIPKEATYDAYTKRVVAQEQKAKDISSSANLDLVRDALEKYKAVKGANPPALQDLVPEFIDHIPGGVQYDPSSGTLSPAS